MTNREKYKQAFSVLHASNSISLEETIMEKKNRKFNLRPALAACLCAAALMGCMCAAYAADVGGIRQSIQLWLHGERVDADVQSNGTGGYTFTTDGESFGGGGVAIGDDGSERPLTAAEVAEDFAVDVDKDDEGRVWLHYYGQSYDLTGMLADGKCKAALDNGGNPLYFDVEDNGAGDYAFSMSSEPTGPAANYTTLDK